MKRGLLLSLLLVLTLAMAVNSWAAASCSTSTCENCVPITFETNISYNPELSTTNTFNPLYNTLDYLKPYTDIRMDSVAVDGLARHGVMFVTGAKIIANQFDYSGNPYRDPPTVINTGRGHNVAFDPYVAEGPTSGVAGATPADMVAAYSNRNLNSINYNRERGSTTEPSVFELSFPFATNEFYFWERGTDSIINIEFLDESGAIVANASLCHKQYADAGYTIFTDTGFPGWSYGAPGVAGQKCSSIGVRLAEGLMAKTLRFKIHQPADFGPDLKVLAAPVTPASASVLIQEAMSLLASLSDDAFKNHGQRNSLMVHLNTANMMIVKGQYHSAASLLDSAVLPKIGSCDSPVKNASVGCPTSLMQRNYLVTIDNLLFEAVDLLK